MGEVVHLPSTEINFTNKNNMKKINKKQNDLEQALNFYEPPTAYEMFYRCPHATTKCIENKDSSYSFVIDCFKSTASIQQVFFRAFQQSKIPYKLYLTDKTQRGKEWYGYIPTLTIEEITIEINGKSGKPEDFLDDMEDNYLQVDSITVHTVAEDKYSNPSKTILDLKVDVCFGESSDFGSAYDIPVFITKDHLLSVSKLSDLIINSSYVFDDCNHEEGLKKLEFEDDAYRRAAFLLLPPEVAVKEAIERAVFQHLRWIVPRGMAVDIKIDCTTEKWVNTEVKVYTK